MIPMAVDAGIAVDWRGCGSGNRLYEPITRNSTSRIDVWRAFEDAADELSRGSMRRDSEAIGNLCCFAIDSALW